MMNDLRLPSRNSGDLDVDFMLDELVQALKATNADGHPKYTTRDLTGDQILTTIALLAQVVATRQLTNTLDNLAQDFGRR